MLLGPPRVAVMTPNRSGDETDNRHIDSGHPRPVWRTLVPAIPVAHGRIPARAFRAPIPAFRERPAPRRSEVRWYPIHVYQHDPPSQSAAGCPEPMCLHRRYRRPMDMWTSPHPCGPARAKAVWTTHGPRRGLGARRQHRAGAAHRLPTLSGLSPTYPHTHIPTGPATDC